MFIDLSVHNLTSWEELRDSLEQEPLKKAIGWEYIGKADLWILVQICDNKSITLIS